MKSNESTYQRLFLQFAVLFVLSFLVKEFKTQFCRDLLFQSQVKDKALTNHTLRTISTIKDADLCMHVCYMEPICSSVNYCQKAGEAPYCELLDSDQSRHGKDLIGRIGCSFYDTKTSCSKFPCPSANASCSGDYEMESPKYRCICPKGYSGKYCEQDIDECKTNQHDCHVNAMCSNTIGGFNCACKCGYHGDGKHCNAQCNSTSWKVIFDFESGKTGWTLTGNAFNNQPTYGDNPKARSNGYRTAALVGDWFIGTFENRPSPTHRVGWQHDWRTGTMTSPPFTLCGSYLRFLIGAGCNSVINNHQYQTSNKLRADLLINGQVVATETAEECSETMAQKMWNVTGYENREAVLRLVDNYGGGWGHINFDHLEGFFC